MKEQYKIISSQTGMHSNLESLVKKHSLATYNKPIPAHQVEVFQIADALVKQQNKPVILDSGCGLGKSSQILAEQNPDHLIIGIDKSLSRLEKNQNFLTPDLQANLILLRADCIDFWRLAANADWDIKLHTIFYPNPWPKPKHIQRRFHGHPVFPVLCNLSKRIILRSNWRLYLEEFAFAFNLLSNKQTDLHAYTSSQAISHFEQKYLDTKVELFELCIS